MFNFAKKVAVASTAAALLTGSAFAASQGSIGATSTGSIDINAVIPGLIQISNLDDIDLGTWSGSGDMTGNDNNCVWSTTRGYNLTATGSGASDAFTITDGSNTIAYAVAWDDVDTTDQAVTTGSALSGQATDALTTNCAGGDTANVTVTVAEADAAAAPAGTYSGTLTLVVAPE